MTPIDIFLKLLAERHSRFEWIGWQMSGQFNLHGQFTAFRAYPKGFEITIAFHDYRNLDRIPDRVFARRGISRSVTHWIEIEVQDTRVRYGRKTVLSKSIAFSDDKDFKILEEIFEGIRKKSAIFTPHAEDRLSSAAALLAMCKELKG